MQSAAIAAAAGPQLLPAPPQLAWHRGVYRPDSTLQHLSAQQWSGRRTPLPWRPAAGQARRTGGTATRATNQGGGIDALPLPPGDFCLPLVGESVELLYSQAWPGADPNAFSLKRQAKYGDVFRSHLLGVPSVVLMGPEAYKFVLSNENKLFEATWPKSTLIMLGKDALPNTVGKQHRRLRSLIAPAFSAEAMRTYVPAMDSIARRHLKSWDGRTASAFEELKQFALSVISGVVFSAEPGPQGERLDELLEVWLGGLFSVPLDLGPFTAFGRALQARAAVLEEVADIVGRRRAALEAGGAPDDLLTRLLTARDEEGGPQLSDSELADNMLALLFAGRDTSASTLTSILAALHHHPAICSKLLEEHERIARQKAAGEALTLEDIRQMTFTDMVVSEALRTTPPVGGAFRRVMQDCQFGGYRIPAGWQVMLPFRVTMSASSFFGPHPDQFFPDRFKADMEPYAFVPFGGGARQCPGMFFARTEIAVFLHHLLTGYSWQVEEPDTRMSYLPLPRPLNGLPVALTSHQALRQPQQSAI